jgi:hypothetical protein
MWRVTAGGGSIHGSIILDSASNNNSAKEKRTFPRSENGLTYGTGTIPQDETLDVSLPTGICMQIHIQV